MNNPDRARSCAAPPDDGADATVQDGKHAALLSPSFLTEVLRTIAAPVCVTDLERRYVFANAAFCALFDLSPEACLGKNVGGVFAGTEASLLEGVFGEVLRGGDEIRRELELTVGGRKRFMDVSCRVASDPASGRRYLVGCVQEVTELKRNEAELIRARDAAEAASRAKSEFIATMSHELRTPLNGSIGMLGLVESTSLTPEQREYLNLAMAANRNLLEIINDILDYVRVISGELRISRTEMSVAEIVRSVVGDLDPQARSKGLALNWRIVGIMPERLLVDGPRLRQILFNLAGNAVKFTRSGQVTLEVEARPGAEAGDVALHFTVSDTGIGIPPEKLEKVLEPFTQADGSFTRNHQGAGLGLSIVKRLVELMGGAIAIESAPGKGCEVAFHVAAKLPSFAREDFPAPRCPVVRPLDILVAEDDGTNQIMIRRMLELMGHAVVCVENGVECIKALRARDFDCILMDVRMPLMNGLDAARSIRSAPGFGKRADIPIVAVTANAARDDRAKVFKAGMDGCLFKPFDMVELSEALARAMVARESGDKAGDRDGPLRGPTAASGVRTPKPR